MMKCSFKTFRQELLKKIVTPIINNSDMSDVVKRQKLLEVIAEISSNMEIGSPNEVEEGLNIVNSIFKNLNNSQKPDTNLIRAAFTQWRTKPNTIQEDTSSERLNKDGVEKFNNDIWESIYGSAMNAKIRAKQQANKVGVESILYNEDGIINSTHDLNTSIQKQQEKLLQDVIKYLKTRVPLENQNPEIFEGKMYKDGLYTGIVEKIKSLYEKFLGQENFDVMSLNKDFNNKNYQRLDAYSSWVILNNFDSVLSQIFGKALAINPDSPKYTAKLNKYIIAGGSNVYNTWRTSEEINLSKEINNITQAIITSIPLVHFGTTTPTEQNIKFNEFVYIISKIKDLPYHAQEDYVFSSENPELIGLSSKAIDFISGKSFLTLINDIRTSPQESLPIIFELLTNNSILDTLISHNVLSSDSFLDVDLDIINSLNLGLFNGEKSLEAIQSKSSYKSTNYFAFITQTIDSIYKAGFLQYFRDPEGKIYVRNMFDQSINNIQYSIQDMINSLNSQMLTPNYDESKYNITETKQPLPENSNTFQIQYNGDTYNFFIQNGEVNAVNLTKNNENVTSQELLNKLVEEYQAQKGIPESIQFTIKNFRNSRPLVVSVNLTNGIITYSVDAQEISGFNDSDYEALQDVIQEVLKQNFTIDQTYFQAFHKGQIGFATTNLMQLVSRVIANQYVSRNYLKGLPKSSLKRKIEEIYGSSDAKPTINKWLNEINVLTEKESGILNLLAQAKALVTGRLTSSQILDSEGNALASSSLSRFISTINYQVLQQVLQDDAAAQNFSLWKQGVYLGIQQLKEIQDNSNGTSKSLTEFSPREFIESAVFIDFLQALRPEKSRTSPIKDGIAAFLPSENADKTYIGRMLVDLKKLQVGEQSIYDLLKTGKSVKSELLPVVFKEIGEFYNKAYQNINNDWNIVNKLLYEKISQYASSIPNMEESLNFTETFLTGFLPIQYGRWDTLNQFAQELGKTPLQLVNEIVTEYNQNNPQNPLVLIDQVHYVADKNGNLSINASLAENIKRFRNLDKFVNFIEQQEVDLLKTLLKDKVNVTANEDFKILLGEDANKWIDQNTGKVILAYEVSYDPTGENILNPIRRSRDISAEGFEINAVHRFILNPLISNYNLLNYFLTTEFMNSTVGAFYAHPSKDKTGNPLFDEKSRKLAQDKRNVSFTAAMHSFQKNLLQGIPGEINIALMSDVEDIFETVSGDTHTLAPFDGATFGNPFFTILENYSLGGAKVGLNKKTFTHFYDQRTGTGGIIKTAEFPLTNNNIRNSKFYQVMMQNMTDRIWLNEDGTPAIVDVTKDYENEAIIFTNPNSQKDGQLYFQNEKGEYYAILSIQSLGNNQYTRTIQQVDRNGNILEGQSPVSENFVINTNYKLWKLFGGERAMELKIGDYILTPTEHSINLVVNIMNLAPGRDQAGNVIKKSDIIKYQSDIWQPLKHSDIHLMPTVGAVKQGAGNINPTTAYTVADPSKINFMRIKMNQSGVQLDKEHHADGEELSIMTQVLSACAARGYTQEQCEEMYRAMASLAKAGIKEYLDAFDEYFQSPNSEAKDKYQKVILDTLIDAFAHNTNTSQMLQMVTLEILNKAKEGKDIEFKDLNKIPYSDPSVFRRLHSTISAALTRAAIKIKVDGILSVLQPSFNAVKLYGDRLLGSFTNDEEITQLQTERDLDPAFELRNNISQLKIGRHYKIVHPDGSVNLAYIRTHNEYYQLKDQLINYPESIVSIREQFAPSEELNFEGGRELAAYNATFSSIDGRNFNFYDLKSVRDLAKAKKDLAQLKKSIKDSGQRAENYELDIKNFEKQIKELLLKVQADYNILSKKQGTLIIDTGEEIQLDPNSIEIEPYEIIMPKVFKDIFGLDTYDDLNEIQNDPEFFTKRLLRRVQVQVPIKNYSVALLRINGNHTYILDANQAVEVPGEFERKAIYVSKDKGKYWRTDSNGKKLYQINKNDEVWTQTVNGREIEVIVTKNIGHYLTTQKFNTLNVSPNSNQENIFQVLEKSKSKTVKKYLKAIQEIQKNEGISINEILNNLNQNNLENHPLEKYFRSLGAEIHSSFLKSLKVVAARIPAQSMQSFMPMKVVAFDAPDINTAYVNSAHFLFEGSDLDIDAVSLASYAFDYSGRYILHSPFANIETTATLEASENLPFPTGEVLQIGGETTLDYSKYITSDITDTEKPIVLLLKSETKRASVNTNTPEAITKLGELIRLCNRLGYIPHATSKIYEPIVKYIAEQINEHNQYINDDSVEDFSKNYIVSSMYKIGVDPANLIESQQALDSITEQPKSIANSTKKAKKEAESLGNTASFATNIHGIAQNMAGKKGVGICAVGLKNYFALTARYNEVLANGTPEEVERLKSEVTIAGQKFRMLANVYTTNEVNAALLGEILSQLDQGQDQALVLSALLSLATDNAKELALDKINASNFLGMYIYGITLGMDFQTLANLISSDTGIILNDLMASNAFTGERGLSMQDIFDYIELGPKLYTSEPLSPAALKSYDQISQDTLWDLAWNDQRPVAEKIKELEDLKVPITQSNAQDVVLNNLIEQAEDYIEQISIIKNDQALVITQNGKQLTETGSVYRDLKNLHAGGEELQTQGKLLHINQGLETQYLKAIDYIETITSVVSSRKYANYREAKRIYELNLREGIKAKQPSSPSGKWKFNFHKFVTNSSYRNAWIDIYGGLINDQMFLDDDLYRAEILKVVDFSNNNAFKNYYSKATESAEERKYKFISTYLPSLKGAIKTNIISSLLQDAKEKLKPSKVFFNILDTMQVPHYFSYLQAADMLHQAMTKTSAKYRAVYELGKKAIDYLGAYSQVDKENILKRTEQLIDRMLRDRFLIQSGYKIMIPKGQKYIRENNGVLEVTTATNSETYIELGTRTGNASFKLLMETKIIPDLQNGKYGRGNFRDSALMNNEFIKSLSSVIYKQNPEYSITINSAPNINMSPRSDTDRALFEQIKYDFNQLRTSPIKYEIGINPITKESNSYDLIELFWLYNQIAFNGRLGENTLTSVFTDLFDYKIVRKFRDFINDFDNNYDLVKSISLTTLIKEVAPKANLWTTKLKNFYDTHPGSGMLAFWSQEEKINKGYYDEYSDYGFQKTSINGYEPTVLSYLTNEDLKNYITTSTTIDGEKTLEFNLQGGRVKAKISQGRITEILKYPLDANDNPDISQEQIIKIPQEYKQYFKKLPMKLTITSNGTTMDYDLDAISARIDNLINCG